MRLQTLPPTIVFVLTTRQRLTFDIDKRCHRVRFGIRMSIENIFCIFNQANRTHCFHKDFFSQIKILIVFSLWSAMKLLSSTIQLKQVKYLYYEFALEFTQGNVLVYFNVISNSSKYKISYFLPQYCRR